MPETKQERNNLPAVVEQYSISPPQAFPSFAEPEPSEAAIPLSHYLWILKRHRWKILSFIAACVLAAVVVSSRLTPIYESTATVDIDRQTPTGVIGQEATRSTTNDADQFLATQIKLIQSDSVLRPVVEKYGLREIKGELEAVEGDAGPARDAPVVLKKLKVVRPPNTYLLLISYRSHDPQLAANVANAAAQSYLEHTYNIRYRSSASLSAFMERQLEELKAKMERSSGALAQFERELNVINPEEKTSILSARLLQLNTEYTNAQADRVRKEAAFQSVRSGSLDAAFVSSQGEALRKLTERQNDAQEKFAEVKTHFGANHPEYKKAAAQLAEVERLLSATTQNIRQRVEIEYAEATRREAMLQKAVQETKAEFDKINARSFEYQALKREAEADKALYEELVRKIKEAGINASFQNSSIRIADPARPAVKPVFPNLKLNVLLAFLFSSLLAVGMAILSDVLDNTVRDPEQAARLLKAEGVGSLPVVKNWKGRLGPMPSLKPAAALAPANGNGNHLLTGYDEAIRTLRNSILLTDFDRRLRSILVTSASPGEGKSTIAAHLAVAHAEQGHKTLLIDGDLRRPSVHRRFEVPGSMGLSNVLVTETSWREAVVKLPHLADLDILPAGPSSRRAADLVGKGLQELLDEACYQYDLVILDAPPLVRLAPPREKGPGGDGGGGVARARGPHPNAVASVIQTLHRLRATVLGVVLNEVHKEMSDSYYYYSHYGKYYRPHNHG
jgi:capsular exopolysaccharide synthesis family protein